MLVFAEFLCLQFLDILTTLVFLHKGVPEANPLMRAAFHIATQPALAMALPKLLAAGLALYAWRSGRLRMLRRINGLFVLCVSWNLFVIALGPSSPL